MTWCQVASNANHTSEDSMHERYVPALQLGANDGTVTRQVVQELH